METKPFKVSGYADDTAIYITHPKLQKITIAEVNQFSAVSGFKLTCRNLQPSTEGVMKTGSTRRRTK